MHKRESGTPKWVSKQIKSKGLQKLRWYCQLCEKQCRDENGFKCHRNSDSHLRQMKLFESNSRKLLDDYSKKFEFAFMKLMKTKYSRTKVLANTVYNDIVRDKNHIHMNATIWTTLTEFIHYLNSTNKCTIENSDKGWYIQYIDHERNRRNSELKAKKISELELEKKSERISGESTETILKESDPKKLHTILLRRNNEPFGDAKLSFEINSRRCNLDSRKQKSIQDVFQLEYEDAPFNGMKVKGKFNRNRSSSLSREGY